MNFVFCDHSIGYSTSVSNCQKLPLLQKTPKELLGPKPMAYGPRKLVLINAGRFDYAEVELGGAIQLVGPNNTGKTTLINSLQFLYLDDRRYMDFGSYSEDQTRAYYFPNQYSYILFEVLGAQGLHIIGWRGQNRIA